MDLGRTTPRVTFSSLCEYLTAGDRRRVTILEDQKYPRTPIYVSYQNALRQIQDHAVRQARLDSSDRRLEPHEREVIEELIGGQWSCPGTKASTPPKEQQPMVLHGVEVSVYPDLVLHGSVKSRPCSGALKFHFPKSRSLDPDVGKWMASFLYQYRLGVEGDPTAHPDLCMIYDVRQHRYYVAGKSHKRLFGNIDSACRFIAAIWESL